MESENEMKKFRNSWQCWQKRVVAGSLTGKTVCNSIVVRSGVSADWRTHGW